MNSPKCGLRLASVLFGLMSLGQLWRLIAQPEVLVGGAAFPTWPSALAFIVLLLLSAWLWRLSNKTTQ
ncbi:hypothetical protein SAMN04487965_3547 [Microbulbifer donghaiensis]|uniref:Uncharacterized protein n=1 Tax=Microbulbifer donghaiensis TaxID=494016 RepID=A0A1M5I265_9GAMM|nr:hypothetical protein [Microbulbifer donghaiensis]SHG22355.1 hypothetical protein SAMN04487965_3547 [Microbulbifer donghaiensis]